MTQPSRLTSELMLIVVVFFWGWTFPIIKDAIAVVPVFAFLFIRFATAFAFMAPIVGIPKKNTFRAGIKLGLILFVAFTLQTWSLKYTSPSVCAFITSLSIIWVAVICARTLKTWTAVLFAVIGLWLLTNPEKSDALNIGDLLAFLCSIFFAWHILVVSRISNSQSSGQLTLIQIAIVALLSFILSLIYEPVTLNVEWSANFIFALIITVFGATIFAYWGQVHYQRYTTTVRAALIFILEPIFAALISILFYDEIATSNLWIGSGFILVAMVVINYKERQTNHQ